MIPARSFVQVAELPVQVSERIANSGDIELMLANGFAQVETCMESFACATVLAEFGQGIPMQPMGDEFQRCVLWGADLPARR